MQLDKNLKSTVAYDRPDMPAFTHQLYMIANVHTQLEYVFYTKGPDELAAPITRKI